MTDFRVWAPAAREVYLRLENERRGMHPQAGGWWHLNVADAGSGMDYQFQVDESAPLPDPRSPWQPHGVHGPSRVFNHSEFAWTDAGWQPPPFSAAVLYELHTGTFTPEGTFDSAIERLEYLKTLGITHVELLPVNEFPGEWGWGYDGVDLFAPHHAYGGPQALKRFVDACHGAGLAVVLDVVYNHLGPSGNYLGQFGPYFTDRYHTPWGSAVNLDGPGSNEVRRFFCDNALMWLRDYHFDGLRLDAVHTIFDSSALHFLEQLAAEVEALETHLGRGLTVTVESDLNDPRLITAREAGGYGIGAQWTDDFHHALHAVLTDERSGYYGDFGTLAHLAKAFTNGFVYDGCESQYRGRRHGRAPVNLPGSRFIVFLQNHDQVGNRPHGERSSALMNTERLKIGAALVLCSPFVPMLFQGEECAANTPFLYFTNHTDVALAHAVSEGRKSEFTEFGWKPEDTFDPQDPASFLKSKLRIWESEPQSSAVFEWHQRLIALRRQEPDLGTGRLDRVRVRFSDEQRWLVLYRGSIAVFCNLAAEARAMQLEPGPYEVLLSSSPGAVIHDELIELPPDSIAILKRTIQER
jgi:maltooligosyltrehalose trehalohydrolase